MRCSALSILGVSVRNRRTVLPDLLNGSGNCDTDFTGRIRMAKDVFQKLAHFRKNHQLSMKESKMMLDMYVISTLMYGI